jgi:DNA-binding response OmpR family regulator
MHILIIEDDPSIGEIYQTYLALNFEITWISDPQQAMAAALATPPGLILLDLMMPNLDGLQVLAQLKADPITSGIPVVMLSNFADDAKAEKAVQMGAVKYIVKSNIELEALSKMCKEYVPATPAS